MRICFGICARCPIATAAASSGATALHCAPAVWRVLRVTWRGLLALSSARQEMESALATMVAGVQQGLLQVRASSTPPRPNAACKRARAHVHEQGVAACAHDARFAYVHAHLPVRSLTVAPQPTDIDVDLFASCLYTEPHTEPVRPNPSWNLLIGISSLS